MKDITWQIAANFDLAPSTISLAALETELHGVPGRQDRLADALARVGHDYDFCIVDCPPNVGLLTFNAMRSSSDVIIPVETGYFSLHGLAKQLELLEQLKKQCHQELKIRILATLYDIRTKLAREVLAELREQFGSLLMEATINFNTKLKEAASFGQPITEYDAASKGFKDFLKLARIDRAGAAADAEPADLAGGARRFGRAGARNDAGAGAIDSRRDAGDPPRWRGNRGVPRRRIAGEYVRRHPHARARYSIDAAEHAECRRRRSRRRPRASRGGPTK